ncbi:unnamed protein product, partial [Meganyctiphanes norvegica]
MDTCDATLRLECGELLHAHKVVIMSFSEYIRKNINLNTNIVKIPIDLSTMKNMIEFFYTNEIILEPSQLRLFLEGARKLKVNCLQTEGLRNILTGITDLDISLFEQAQPQKDTNKTSEDVNILKERDNIKENGRQGIENINGNKRLIAKNEGLAGVKLPNCISVLMNGRPLNKAYIEQSDNALLKKGKENLVINEVNDNENNINRVCKNCHCKNLSEEINENPEEIIKDNETETLKKRLIKFGTKVTGSSSLLDIPAWITTGSSISLSTVKIEPAPPVSPNSPSRKLLKSDNAYIQSNSTQLWDDEPMVVEEFSHRCTSTPTIKHDKYSNNLNPKKLGTNRKLNFSKIQSPYFRIPHYAISTISPKSKTSGSRAYSREVLYSKHTDLNPSLESKVYKAQMHRSKPPVSRITPHPNFKRNKNKDSLYLQNYKTKLNYRGSKTFSLKNYDLNYQQGDLRNIHSINSQYIHFNNSIKTPDSHSILNPDSLQAKAELEHIIPNLSSNANCQAKVKTHHSTRDYRNIYPRKKQGRGIGGPKKCIPTLNQENFSFKHQDKNLNIIPLSKKEGNNINLKLENSPGILTNFGFMENNIEQVQAEWKEVNFMMKTEEYLISKNSGSLTTCKKINKEKTKVMVSKTKRVKNKSGFFPCGCCWKGVGANSLWCEGCQRWCHKRCSKLKSVYEAGENFRCPTCIRGIVGITEREDLKLEVDHDLSKV